MENHLRRPQMGFIPRQVLCHVEREGRELNLVGRSANAQGHAVLLAACLGERPLSGAASGRELREALQLTQREEFRVSAQYAQAMAWEIENPFGVTIVDKPGGLDNASAYIGLVPERKIGLVILANRGDVHPFEMARSTILPELARLLTPQALGSTARQ